MAFRHCRICSVFFFFSFALASAAPRPIDGIAAIVGDSVILNSEVDAYVVARLSAAGRKPDTAELPGLRKQYINDLIDGKILIVWAAKDTNIVVKDAEIDQALKGQIQMILQQNNITLATLEQELKSKYGMSLEKFKAQMRSQMQEQLTRQAVQRFYIPSGQVGRKDVEAFYAKYKDSLPPMGESVLISKIVVHVQRPDSVRQKVFQRITQLKKRLDKGEDFAALAKQFSEDPNAENGGDLGFIKKGTLSEIAFEERAFALGTGQVSDIFETRLGFHIIKVSERQEQSVHVSQIFLKDSPPEQLMKKTMDQLDSVRTHCQSAENFIAAVRRLSTDNQNRASNGRVGWASLYGLEGPLRTIIDSLQPGQISAPQRDGDECVLYRLDDKQNQRKLTIEDDFDLLADKAREMSGQAKLINLVKRWRKDVFVDIRL